MTTSLPRQKVVVLCSGGPASATLAFLLSKGGQKRSRGAGDTQPSSLRLSRGLAPAGYDLHLLIIQDQQRSPQPALRAVRLIAGMLDTSCTVLLSSTLSPLPALIEASPHARLFALAGAVAVRQGVQFIAAGMHDPDMMGQYTAFATGFNQRAERGTEVLALPPLHLMLPLGACRLADVLILGQHLGVPLERTWSCLEDSALQCGRCEPCLTRQAAFAAAGIRDQTRYRASASATPFNTDGPLSVPGEHPVQQIRPETGEEGGLA